jgi:lysophospholipase L1-like esterase
VERNPSTIPVLPPPFEHPLTNFARSLQGEATAKVVALGSSTIAGEGDVVALPYRLEALLRKHYAKPIINVISRGIGGQEAPVERDRMKRDVIAEQPSLVIWQVGTNAVWQKPDNVPPPPSFADTVAAIRDGLAMLRDYGKADVILMDLQYVPAVLTPAKADKANQMVEAIDQIAREAGVNLFGRFTLMKGWHEVERVSFDRMVDPEDTDRLHDSDWTTQRLAWVLKDIIIDAVSRAQSVPAA